MEWKAKSRIDCWGPRRKDETRSANISQTRRKTSAVRSPRNEIHKVTNKHEQGAKQV